MSEFNVNNAITRLSENIINGLASGESQRFAFEYYQNCIGFDLSLVWAKWSLWTLTDKEYGIIQFCKEPAHRNYTLRVASMYERWIGGDEPSRSEWKKLAYDKDFSYCHAYSSACDSAYFNSDASAYSYSNAYASACDYGKPPVTHEWRDRAEKALTVMAAKLLELLAAAPVIESKKDGVV